MSKKGLSPEEFNRYINQKLPDDKIELFYRANFVNPLKVELFKDFTITLLNMMHDTYPGDDVSTDAYYSNHFKFCFDRVIKGFQKEDLFFSGDGKDIYEYFYLTLEETFYKDPNKNKTILALIKVYEKIFNMENMDKTQSDMEIFLDLYKSFIKLFINKAHETTTNLNK